MRWSRTADGVPRDNGLTAAQREVLRLLTLRPGLRTSEVAATLHLRANSASGLLSALVRAGWLRREQDVEDRRSARFWATEQGVGQRAGQRGTGVGALGVALRELDADDQAAIGAALPALERLVEALASRREGATSR